MSSSRLVRGAKTRMFAIVCLICVLGAVVFVFHGTQSKLAEVQKLVNSCNQQQESLSAQLQVIFEYKVRLEKSLTKEKEDHKLTKETLEGKLTDERKVREKENLESKNKYDALVQQNKFLQTQLDDLKENEKSQVFKLNEEAEDLKKELEMLRKENKDLLKKKDVDLEHLKSEYLKQQDDIIKLTQEKEDLKNLMPKNNQIDHLDKENYQLKEEMEKLKTKLSECEDTKPKPKKEAEPQPDTNVGVMPKMVYSGQKINGSTTPGLNPDALNNYDVSSTKPIKEPEVAIKKKPDDQVAQPPKRPTQESVRPLPLPGQQEAGQSEFGQIPVPGGHDPLGNTLHKPNTGENQDAQLGGPPMNSGGQGEPDVQPRMFAPPPPDNREEENNFIKPMKLDIQGIRAVDKSLGDKLMKKFVVAQ
ncbi:Golgi integral membrane protein 4 isoform X2 [Halyomorpha halys]|uniref:Golgi integral membrane protein 4 isoform X2 n=1 Tax=Halyomorpha halys TaxID=286706 RepID=UPI0006D4E989|nr:Golgi integral membrane protein 4 isoform X2 [Halyomorpha halys]